MTDNELIERFYVEQGQEPKNEPDLWFYGNGWNKLMSVVEKIERTSFSDSFSTYTNFAVRIEGTYCCIYSHEIGRQCGVVYQTPYGVERGNKMAEVYKAVIAFIKWYNERQS